MFSYYVTSQHTHIGRVTEDMLTPYQVLTNVVEEGINAGDIRAVNVSVMTAMVMGAVHQIAINKIYSRINGELHVYSDLVSNMIANMLKVEGVRDE